MKLNGALKPRQGASKEGSSTGVVLKKYRDKRYYKLNKNVAYGLSQYNNCGPSYTGQKQKIVKYSKNNYKNINRQKKAQSQIKKQQENVYDKSNYYNSSSNNNNNNNNSISSISRKIQNKATEYKITTITRTIITTVTKRSFCFIDFNSDKKATLFERTNKNNNNNNNITTRQVENNKKDNKSYCNINSKSSKNKNKSERKQTKEGQVVKTAKHILKHNVNVNKSNNNNNNDNSNSNNNNNKHFNSVLIYSMKQQQQQQQQLTVNKFLSSIVKTYENLVLCALIILAAIISRFFVQLKLLFFFMYSHASKNLNGSYRIDSNSRDGISNHKREIVYSSTVAGSKHFVVTYGFRLAKIMRASQSLTETTTTFFKNANKSRLKPTIALWMIVSAAVAILLPQPAVGDDVDNFFPINGIETTTPEFDYASRGQKKFGDKCENTLECGFPGSICDPKKKSCQCTEDLPVTNHIDKCGKEAAVNESCFFNEQCEVKYFQTECRDQRCVCRFDMTPVWLKDGTVECKGRGDKKGPETYVDPAMIGVLIGMALMFIIICVVLRLFSQARWRENRTIFNTPNPRLMNVSLLRESKLLHGQERRGSRMSVRVPSRQPSMASLRPHSPNPSLGKTGSRSNSHGSNASATSLRSTRSNSVSPAGITVNNTHHDRKGSTYQPHHHSQTATHLQQQEQQPLTQTNIISNPVAETVTVEIIEPEK